MANKLTALILLFIAAMAATASAYTTVVTTTMSRDECEMEEQMPLTHCMRYVKSSTKGPYLMSAVANRRFKEDHLEACCKELRQMSDECRCGAVRGMVMEMPQSTLSMERMACSLPSQCEMRPCACPRIAA